MLLRPTPWQRSRPPAAAAASAGLSRPTQWIAWPAAARVPCRCRRGPSSVPADPLPRSQRAAPPPLPEGHAAAPQQSAAAGDALAEQVQLLGRANSFLRCVAGSPLLKSALLALEAAGAHPPVPAGSAAPAGLEWTLAQMLALSRRAGDNTGVCACGKRAGQWSVAGPPTQRVCVAADPSTARRSPAPPRPPAASEAALLAGLWLLESANDGNCSPRHRGAGPIHPPAVPVFPRGGQQALQAVTLAAPPAAADSSAPPPAHPSPPRRRLWRA